ncbi:MAG: uncharacterized protein A8A55_0322 [Amphiamblys sp. WSBS2006]|nr:MAG: uncharacterized protein A8A55_0322 [Amphiamblys sp. WSBS2006]
MLFSFLLPLLQTAHGAQITRCETGKLTVTMALTITTVSSTTIKESYISQVTKTKTETETILKVLQVVERQTKSTADTIRHVAAFSTLPQYRVTTVSVVHTEKKYAFVADTTTKYKYTITVTQSDATTATITTLYEEKTVFPEILTVLSTVYEYVFVPLSF